MFFLYFCPCMEKINQSQRYIWIDHAKFISIFLVVYFHSPPVFPTVLNTSLGLLRMSCFFFLSGLLFNFDKYPVVWNFAKHRSKQLLIPYFSFFVLLYVYWLLWGYKYDPPGTPFYQPLFEYVYGRPDLLDIPLWFISCLFAMQMFFYLFLKLIKNRFVATIILLATPFIPDFIDLTNAPWMLDNVCIYFPFYGIAALYRKEIMQNLGKGKIQLLYGIIVLFVFISIVYLLTSGTVNTVFLRTGLKTVGSFCILFPVLLIIKYLTDFCGEVRFTKYIAMNAIVVLALHAYVILAIHAFVSLLGYPSTFFDGRYLLKFLIAVFTVTVMVIPIYLINRYFPFMLGKTKK